LKTKSVLGYILHRPCMVKVFHVSKEGLY